MKLEAADLIEAYEKGELKGKLKEIAANLKKDDSFMFKRRSGSFFRDDSYPPFYPRYMDEEGTVAGYWTAPEWLEFVEEHAGTVDIPENLRNVKYDDNPILVVARVKK